MLKSAGLELHTGTGMATHKFEKSWKSILPGNFGFGQICCKFGQISQVGGTVYDNLSPRAGGGVRAQEVEPHTIKPYYLGGISIFRSKKTKN